MKRVMVTFLLFKVEEYILKRFDTAFRQGYGLLAQLRLIMLDTDAIES